MKNSELKALITLLDDPNFTVYESVEKRLKEIGPAIVPELKDAWEHSEDELFLERTSAIISNVLFEDIFNKFKKWIKEDSDNLQYAVFLIAKYNFPDIDYQSFSEQIDNLKNDANLQINDNLSPLEKIWVLNHIFYTNYKFRRSTNDFYSPKNSYINRVLETKQGNTVSLAIIYLLVANKLALPVYGVNLPKNFILAYTEESLSDKMDKSSENRTVSFYINPYNNGAILTKSEIEKFLKQQKIASLDIYFNPCNNRVIIQRLLENLVYSYQKLHDSEKVNDLKKFIELFESPLQKTNSQ